MNLTELAERAEQIKADIEALHADTYKVVEWSDGNNVYYIIASYSLEENQYQLAVTNVAFVEIKLLSELPTGIFKVLADVAENVLKLPAAGKITPLSVSDVAERAERAYREPKDVDSFGLK